MALPVAGLLLCVGLWCAAVVVDWRGARCSWAMYTRDLRYLTAPLNATLYLCTSRDDRVAFPPLDARMFPHLAAFRQHWQAIRSEAARVSGPELAYSDRGFALKHIGNPHWRQFYIRWHGTTDPVAAALCPMTTRLVEAAPEIKVAFFSVVEPNSYIKPHVGPYRGVLRYQMGLLTPNDPGCFICVDDTRYVYHDGEDTLFDDTYLHHVENRCDRVRVILFLDVERPMRSWIGCAFNRVILWGVSLFPSKANAAPAMLGPADARSAAVM